MYLLLFWYTGNSELPILAFAYGCTDTQDCFTAEGKFLNHEAQTTLTWITETLSGTKRRTNCVCSAMTCQTVCNLTAKRVNIKQCLLTNSVLNARKINTSGCVCFIQYSTKQLHFDYITANCQWLPFI